MELVFLMATLNRQTVPLSTFETKTRARTPPAGRDRHVPGTVEPGGADKVWTRFPNLLSTWIDPREYPARRGSSGG